MKLFDLTGRLAIVTGANKGLGKAMADALRNAGADVREFNRQDGYDVTCAADIRRFVSGLERIDILVNNAGVTGKSWDETLAVNLKAPYEFSEAVKPKMAAGRGSIVNIASINSFAGFPNNPSYVSSKHGIVGLTRSQAVDYGSLGIRVNAIAPGYCQTDMTKRSWENYGRRDLISRHTVLGRWGRPEDMAGPVVFLSSDAAAYVTGQILSVDGGWTIKGVVDE